MVNITKWSPDTCGCVVDYSWDRDSDPKNRQHTLHNVEKKCDAHALLSDAEVYAAITDENPRKNKALDIIAKNVPEFSKPVFENGKKIDDVIDENSDIEWSFDEQRILRIKSVSMKSSDKALLRNKFIDKFGENKVIVE